MAKAKTVVPFKGTAEQEKKLKEIIASYKDVKGALIPVLQQAQELYGYMPIEVQKMIAEGLGVSLAEVYGVVSFYALFTLNPKGENRISVCLGTACYVKGSAAVLERVQEKLGLTDGQTITTDGKFSVDSTRCIGACSLAPCMVINDKVYGRLVPDDVDKILAEYGA
ncbi:MAG: NAD(P)H-dependent oxidoreductase subunit E [Clostridia bacterium]|jgi:NADP-reducing hydrogenase subunit HndA|nr:NAD(P)H-dependent oxidoreductase subunit E [Clostridia bacterium]